MPVTQIDLVSMAPKTNETLPIKTAEMQKPVTDNLNAFAQVEKHIQDSADTTIRPSRGETPEFRYESGEREAGGGQAYDSEARDLLKKKKGAKKHTLKASDKKESKGHGIDLRV